MLVVLVVVVAVPVAVDHLGGEGPALVAEPFARRAIWIFPLLEELLDGLRADRAVAALGLPVQGHAVLLRLVAALAVGARLEK